MGQASAYIEYDPDMANSLLDGAGYDAKNARRSEIVARNRRTHQFHR